MIKNLYPVALSCGVGVFDFWDCSIAEIEAIIKSYMDATNRKQKEQILCYDFLAGRITEYVGVAFGSGTMRSLSELCPDLFVDNGEIVLTQIELNKANMRAYAEQHNNREGG